MSVTILQNAIPGPSSARDIPGQIYRVASVNDLLRLKAAYPEPFYKRHCGWTLKQLGQLWVVDALLKQLPEKVLEIGPGVNTFFADFCYKHGIEYWAIDEASTFFTAELFEKSVVARKNTHFIRGLFGSCYEELEAGAFDMVFSISTVEHVPDEHLPLFWQEQKRIISPKGHAVHTIDCNFLHDVGAKNMKVIEEIFVLNDTMVADLMWRTDSLVETLDHQYYIIMDRLVICGEKTLPASMRITVLFL